MSSEHAPWMGITDKEFQIFIASKTKPAQSEQKNKVHTMKTTVTVFRDSFGSVVARAHSSMRREALLAAFPPDVTATREQVGHNTERFRCHPYLSALIAGDNKRMILKHLEQNEGTAVPLLWADKNIDSFMDLLVDKHVRAGKVVRQKDVSKNSRFYHITEKGRQYLWKNS